MANQRWLRATTALVFITLVTESKAAKNSARPVHEIINEQARADDRRTQNAPFLPYGNPLAGNSQQNAKLHAQNQQAMFNAERVRQHRAQLQRLNKATQQTDSYMRAYHESQENHQIVLEQQQAKLGEFKPSSPVTRPSSPVTRPPPRQRQAKRPRRPDLMKIMEEESVLTDKSRNHRSYGSSGYKSLHEKMYKTVYVTPGPNLDQGVTIKPNGNAGLTHLENSDEPSPLYTQAIPSHTQYIYPRQLNQMQHYESAQDIAALNSLLKKEPQDQLLELNALVQPEKPTHHDLETPIDLYFYLKNPNLAHDNAQSTYAQIAPNYASAYMPQVKDHTPITEDIDDIDDPNKVAKRPFNPQPIASATPKDITTNNINYYSIQPTVATSPEYYQQTEENPSYAALVYEKPLKIYTEDARHESTSERYLSPNLKHLGVQHLNVDGTGTSAYGDDNVSISVKNNRTKRSSEKLDTEPFLLPKNSSTAIEMNEKIAQPEALRSNRLHFQNSYGAYLPTQYSPVHSFEDNYNDYDEVHQTNEYDEDDEYNLELDEPDFQYGVPNHKQSNLFSLHQPSRAHHYNPDLKASYSNTYNYNKNPTFHNKFKASDFSTSYGVPEHFYNLPDQIESHKTPDISSVVDALEPVYMLTQSQLKSLIGHHNLNIQQLDVYQWQTKTKSKRPHRVRKFRKNNHRHVPSGFKKNLLKLHKLSIL